MSKAAGGTTAEGLEWRDEKSAPIGSDCGSSRSARALESLSREKKRGWNVALQHAAGDILCFPTPSGPHRGSRALEEMVFRSLRHLTHAARSKRRLG